LTLASATWAGSLGETPTEPTMEPMVEVAPAPYDWSGFYAGLSAGKSGGDFSYTDIGSPSPYLTQDLDGMSYGIHGGYNFQNGNFVYGIELALQSVDAEREPYPDSHFKSAGDLKLRLGYAMDNVLLYAFGGLTKAKWHNDSGVIDDYDMDGTNLGIGAEMAFRDNWLVGLEYITRDLSGDLVPDYDENIDSTLNTVQLRVGYKF
jgi:outer membrane immunogenic protein